MSSVIAREISAFWRWSRVHPCALCSVSAQSAWAVNQRQTPIQIPVPDVWRGDGAQLNLADYLDSDEMLGEYLPRSW